MVKIRVMERNWVSMLVWDGGLDVAGGVVGGMSGNGEGGLRVLV